jgi:hypothetical protein
MKEFVMKKYAMLFLGIAMLMGSIAVLVTCLSPIQFDPNSELPVINAVITGEIDAWLKDNSVLWVVNKSKTVDINELTISRDDNDPTYPINYPPGDIYRSGVAVPHGTSLASYHKPAPHNPIPWYKVEITYSTQNMVFPEEMPEWWNNSYGINYGVYPPAGPFHTITVTKQMPRGMDYVILFYKTSDGCLMVVDEDTEKHVSSDNDTTGNTQIVLPPNGNQLIVSGIINAIISGQISITGLDADLERIVNEINNSGQVALHGLGDLGTVINNAFDKHAETLLNAFLNHKIEIYNNVNVDTGMETLIDYLRERYNQRVQEKSITIYNASSSVIIDSIDIYQNNFRAATNGNIIQGGDSYNIYLQSPERNFDIDIQYHYIGSSAKHIKTNKIAITGTEYIVFYKQIGDNFAINKTTDMNMLISSADRNDFIVNNEVNSVKFNILNEASAMRVVGLAIKKYRATDNDLMYYKEDTEFASRGPIGAAGGNDSIMFSSTEAKIESGESYTIYVIGDDYRDAIGKGHIAIEVQRPLYIGGAVTLTVTESMVQNAIRNNMALISYQVTADGGIGDPRVPTYDTTMLTFTFDSAPLVIPVFDYIGGVTVGQLNRTGNPLVFTAACTAVADGEIQIICTNEQASRVTAATHYVRVFKSQPAVVEPIITTRYIFNDAYIENKVVQRNVSHQLLWVLKYDVVTFEDGVETNRQTVTKNQFGEFQIDSSTNSGYISFTKTGLLKVGPRPVGAIAYSGNDKEGVAEWELYECLVFGQTVDGHLIENMPYQSVPLWLGPIQIGSKKVYGLQVTLIIQN